MKRPVLISIWAFAFFALVSLFTLFQLPNSKLANAIHSQVQANLDPIGIYIIPNGIQFSVLRGFRLHYERPTIELPDLSRIQLDEMDVGPSFAMLFRGFAGGYLELRQGAGTMKVAGGVRGNNLRLTGDFDQLELSRIGAFAWAGGIQGKALLTGDLNVSGSMAEPSTFQGAIHAKGKGIQIDEQNLFGFALPEIKIQEAVIAIPIESGKVNFKEVRLGKSGASDDVTLQVSGDLTLARNLNSSPLNLKLLLGLSDKVKPKFQFIDTLFANSKQPDGRYQFVLGGTLNQPMPIR